jgi:hypothetical protein
MRQQIKLIKCDEFLNVKGDVGGNVIYIVRRNSILDGFCGIIMKRILVTLTFKLSGVVKIFWKDSSHQDHPRKVSFIRDWSAKKWVTKRLMTLY